MKFKVSTKGFPLLRQLTAVTLTLTVLFHSLAKVVIAQKSLPWASKDSYDCINDCIDMGMVYCKEKIFGFCCDPRRCGNQTGFCSGQN